MNILPKNVMVGHVGGQGFKAEVYDNDTYAGMQFAQSILMLIFFGIIAPFISPLLCLFVLLGFDGRFKIGYILCILFSAGFLYDAYSGWLITTTASIAFDEPMMNILVGVNASVIAINVVLLFFGHLFINAKDRTLFLIPLAVVVPIAYIYAHIVCTDNPDWINRNLQIGDYKVEQTF